MKIVVTGALGHIGSALIRGLPEAYPEAEIVMLDNFLVQRYPSLFDLPAAGRYRFIEADVTEAELEPILAGADAVVHLAAITDAAGSFAIADQVEKVNYTATERVATAAAAVGAGMIFISTTSVYGTQENLVDEDCALEELQPQSPYAETKLKEEALLARMGAEQGLRFITCRFGTIFGPSPGMRFHTAVNKFCWQAVMGSPITVWRTAMNQMRPYLDVRDAVRAIQLILDKQIFSGEIFNVLTLNATVADILAAIETQIAGAQVEYVDAAIMNQLSYEVANKKFAGMGFEVRGDLSEQVAATIRLLGQARSAEQRGG